MWCVCGVCVVCVVCVCVCVRECVRACVCVCADLDVFVSTDDTCVRSATGTVIQQ